MADVIDFKTRERKVIDLATRRRMHLETNLDGTSVVSCPYCQRRVELPAGYPASFTCQVKQHLHMRDGRSLREVR
jgi:hypothetical protein